MSTALWARAAAVSSAATLLLFVTALLTSHARPGGPQAPAPGPYAALLRLGLLIAGVVLAAVTAWRYERLARGHVPGRPRWRVPTACWALIVITLLIVVEFPPSPWAAAAWVTALAWAIAASTAARRDRAAHR